VPVKDIHNPYAIIYFVLAVVIGNFFLLNLFIGVIITKFNREKELAGKDFMLSDEQKQWVQNRMMILHSQPLERMSKPKREWRHPFFYLAESKMF
jgi:Ion transport protein